MSRYAAMFDRCSAAGEGAFGAFLMLGDPDPSRCAGYLDALVEGGADMVELGMPFSDPVADGAVIQAAAQRALAAGVRAADALRLIEDFRARHASVPIGVLTYANIAVARGFERFCHDLVAAGADSLLIADVPTIEAEPFAAAARSAALDLVMIAAPNTPCATIDRIAALSSGYTYCVARAGVTGADHVPNDNHRKLFDALTAAGAPPPVLGFGIASPQQAATAIAGGAAGVISGSAIVGRIGAGAKPKEIAQFVRSMKAACRMPEAVSA